MLVFYIAGTHTPGLASMASFNQEVKYRGCIQVRSRVSVLVHHSPPSLPWPGATPRYFIYNVICRAQAGPHPPSYITISDAGRADETPHRQPCSKHPCHCSGDSFGVWFATPCAVLPRCLAKFEVCAYLCPIPSLPTNTSPPRAVRTPPVFGRFKPPAPGRHGA